MMMFVFVGLRYIWVVSCPLSWRLRSISRKAIFPSSSASRVNFTREWTALRHSLKAAAGSVVLLLLRRPGRRNWRDVMAQIQSSI